MGRIYNAYLEDAEREMMIESAKNDLTFARYAVMLEMVDQKLALNKKAAELKVLEEFGTYEDLEYLYTEAENEANQEKTGIVQSIINAIRTVLQSISNAIKGFVNKNKNNENLVEVDANAYENGNKLINGWNSVSSALTQSDSNKFGTISKAILGLLGTFAAIEAGNKIYKKVKYKDVADKVTKIDNINNTILGALDKFKNGKFKIVTDAIQNLVKKIQEIITGLKITIPGKKKKEENAGDGNQTQGNNGTTGTDQGNAGAQETQPQQNNEGTKTESVDDFSFDEEFGDDDFMEESYDEIFDELDNILNNME